MSSGVAPPGGARARIAAALLVPLLVLVVGELSARWARERPAEESRARLLREASGLQQAFLALDEAARAAALLARERSPEAAVAAAGDGPLEGRTEGALRTGADGRAERWAGTPADAPSHDPSDGGAAVRVQGARTRLFAWSPPDRAGRVGSASFVLDARAPGLDFGGLVRHAVDPSLLGRIEFAESDADERAWAIEFGRRDAIFVPGRPVALTVPLRTAAGACAGVARLQEIPASYRADERRSRAAATAALALALLVALLGGWPARSRSLAGLAAAAAAIVLVRAALVASGAPALLLPRELGSPSLYGTTALWDAFSSPADVLLSCLAWLLGARAVRAALRHVPRQGTAGVAAAAASATAAALSVWGLLALSTSLAVNGRVPLLRLEELLRSPAQAVLLAGLLLALHASADLLGAAAARLPIRAAALRSERRMAVASGLALAALTSTVLLGTLDRIALERLHTEFAPLVLEQWDRRQSAVLAAAREAAASELAVHALTGAWGETDPYSAYKLWAGTTLFRQGWQSSLDLYGSGEPEPRSTFAFDVAPLVEAPPSAGGTAAPAEQTDGAGGAALAMSRDAAALALGEDAPPAAEPAPLLRADEVPEAAVRQRVLHAEMPVIRSGVHLGTIVAHVVDEPDNLPFLPSVAPYLAALGFGGGSTSGVDATGAPEYVLYDVRGGSGTVAVATLADVPAPSRALLAAARRSETVPLHTGDEEYRALPLLRGGWLHLLLLPARTALDWTGAFVRLAIVLLASWAAWLVVHLSLRRGRWARLVHGIRGSFARKLLLSLLVASMLPLVGLAVFLRGYIERRGDAALVEDAARLSAVVRQVIEDYQAVEARAPDGGQARLTDAILHWLGRVVGQEILVFEDGVLTATSTRELFSSGLLTRRLPGEVARSVGRGRRASTVRPIVLADRAIPVAYTALRGEGDGGGPTAIAAVPLILEQQEAARSVEEITGMLMLATVLLGALLALVAAPLTRAVADPVRALAAATGRISAGDYETRLSTRSTDEVAALVQGFNAMARALSEQRADLERRRDYMEALLRNATTGVLSTDAAGRIVTLNPAAAALLTGPGGRPQVGERLDEALDRTPELSALRGALARDGRPLAREEEVDLVRGGKARRLRLVRVPLPDPQGGPAGALVLLEDVTELMRSNQLAAWAEMARAIAHEIKNPLTPIQLSTEHLERLLRDRGVLPSRDVDACLETVIKQVRALREIASEFSTYARLPDLAPEPADPAAFLAEVVAPYRAAHPPGIDVVEEYEPAPPAAIDRRVLGRAIVNLIENALQAMTGGGTLRVSCRADADDVVLSVADTGPGLDPVAQARLFEPYFSTKSSGTGLGLAIVRRAVEAHGGRIEVDSVRGRGTTFRLLLPRRQEAGLAVPHAGTATTP